MTRKYVLAIRSAAGTPPARENDYIYNPAGKNRLGRGAEPREIAEAVCLLALDADTYCAGERMIVSGQLAIA